VAQIKHANKAALAGLIAERTGVVVNPAAIFDVQVKRIHEYKRQHLNILHVIGLYHRLKTIRSSHGTARVRVRWQGGAGVPTWRSSSSGSSPRRGDHQPRSRRARPHQGRLPAEIQRHQWQKIYPAADLSEQISTAGKEASGTGNMKFQMNGALTIGTVDGANVEICEEVGVENFFLFGLEAHEVAARRAMGYRPTEFLEGNEELQAVIQLIRDGFFSRGNSSQFLPLIDNLIHHDPYFVLADYQSYADCQTLVNESYRDKEGWTRMSILNSARSGKFSSDRTIREYCSEIWHAKPVRVQLLSQEEVKAGLLQ
jgi:starch phosphorylase